MKLSFRVSLPELDESAFTIELRRSCKTALNKAARSFLLTAIPRVPVFTGFARGAFGNLEDLVGKVSGGTINRKLQGESKPRYLQRKRYYYYPPGAGRVLRNTISGRQFATDKGDIFTKPARASIAEGQSAFFFQYRIDITYFDILDRRTWHSFNAGSDAFNDTLRLEFERLKPRIGKYVVRREVK